MCSCASVSFKFRGYLGSWLQLLDIGFCVCSACMLNIIQQGYRVFNIGLMIYSFVVCQHYTLVNRGAEIKSKDCQHSLLISWHQLAPHAVCTYDIIDEARKINQQAANRSFDKLYSNLIIRLNCVLCLTCWEHKRCEQQFRCVEKYLHFF